MWKLLLAALALAGPTAATAQSTRYELPPLFENCGDGSYAKAKSSGVTLGISPSPPYSSLDPATGKAAGLDVELNEGALAWGGIGTVRYEVMPFGQLIPALLSGRIDVVASNIHVTADRLKAVSFTGPAWWYGPTVAVPKGNPAKLTGFGDLKGHSIGVIAGSAADEYLRKTGVETTVFQTDAEQFAALASARVDGVVDDDVKVLDFIAANTGAGVEVLPNIAVPDELISQYGYGYARYAVRKEDCSLRAAMSQGLAEVRGSGLVSAVLKRYGLSNRNLFLFPL